MVSFGSLLTTFQLYVYSRSIPHFLGPPFIAANWYNFHTYSAHSFNKGRVYYRSTSSGDY